MGKDKRSRRPLQRSSGGSVEEDTKTYVTEHCYVKVNSPDANFGYPTIAEQRITKDGSALYWAVFKFSEQLLSRDSADIESVILSLGDINDGIEWSGTFIATERIIDLNYELHAIREDFDASALTYNILAGLDTSNIGDVARFRNDIRARVGDSTPVSSAHAWSEAAGGAEDDGQGFISSSVILKELFDPAYGAPAYGFFIRAHFTAAEDPADSEVWWTATRKVLKTGTEKYASSIEWY